MTHQNSPSYLGQKLAQSAQAMGHRLTHKHRFNRQRRFFLMGAGALMVSACTSKAQTDPSSSVGSTSETKQIQHAFGTTEVATTPRRIAVLDYFTVAPPAENEIDDVGNPRAPSLARLAALKPDLILAPKLAIEEDTYGLLSRIAPTVVFDNDGFTEWQALTQLCAELMGKEAEAAQLKADYEAKLQQLKSQLDASQIQVSVAVVNSEQVSVFSKKTFIGTVLDAAGLSRPPKQMGDADTRLLPISLELLNEIDGDVLFVIEPQSQTEIAADVRAALEKIQANPLWNKLSVVQSNQVYEVDAYWFGMGYIAANLVLDDLMEYIVKAS